MWDETFCSTCLEVTRGGRKLTSCNETGGTAVALPMVSSSIRYYELEVLKNKGGIYMGALNENELLATFGLVLTI